MFKNLNFLLVFFLIGGFFGSCYNINADQSNNTLAPASNVIGKNNLDPKQGDLPNQFNVAGYYGNSGNVVPSIPVLSAVNPAYNIIILTFLAFSSDAEMNFQIQGPYESASASPEWTISNVDQTLLNAINDWKSGKDVYGRERYVLISVGGEKGSLLPDNNSTNQELVKTKILEFINAYNLDGFDIDVEGVHDRSLFIPLLKELRGNGKIITSAPQAFVTELNDYRDQDIFKYCDYVGIQCYNQAPNSMSVNWSLFAGSWTAPSRWDALGQVDTYKQWMCAIWASWQQWKDDIEKKAATTTVPYGPLAPASGKAAGGQGGVPWDFTIMSHSLINLYDGDKLETNYVGTWSIGCDIEAGNPFATAMTTFLEHKKKKL